MRMYSTFLTSTPSDKHGLLFVAGLDLAEEIFHFGIQFQFEENAIHLENPLSHQLFAIKLRKILITRIA